MKYRYFNLRFNMDNEVFARDGIFEEIPLILNTLANKFKCDSSTPKKIYDSNGNYIGTCEITFEAGKNER